ncbi:YgcG family protein [Geobacter sp. SVR]|uniref:TPM domain-containing protein n=1 Tax=Geobacter sp. SVR TaxID=2495594 RepID=UPI001566E91F|nr:TPM domain-containing protein [Geobacter sp. SVR]
MNKLILLFFLLLLPRLAFGLDVPPLVAHVNDYAGMLSADTARTLERSLAAFEQSDSTQIVLLTVPTLAGENLEEFSIKVAEAWRIGRKGVDNGVILLIARDDRRVRIEVGMGLEGRLTDLVSGRIIRGEITPRFKAGDFEGGIIAGTTAIMEAVKGEYHGTGNEHRPGKRSMPGVATMLIFLLVACVFLGSISRFLGGLAGAVGAPTIAFLAFPGLALAAIAVLAAGGFLLGLLLAFLFGGGGRGGGFFGGGPFIGGGGFGGGFGGGGYGGGGFSGGGGDFGGGGASGDW